jgi:hypothetical protein
MYNVTFRRVCAHCYSEKAIIITQPVCIFVTLVTQEAIRMRHTVICGLSGSTVFFHIMSSMASYNKKNVLKIKC